jgi:predicted ATPase
MSNKRFIITGAPCTGKSTVLELLKTKGYPTVDEVARQIIKQELAIGSNKVPWLDNDAFSALVVEKQIQDYQNRLHPISFFDRGIPDVLAYMNHFNSKKHFDSIKSLAQKHLYENKIFLFPPWENIYQTDNERLESFEQSTQIHQELLQIYQDLNYTIITMPFCDEHQRTAFILSHIE